MLSVQDNETLVRVGSGTATGELIRRFWIPAVMTSEVAEPDGKPVRVRLLGEDLVAFRDTKGRVGLLEERCPHRRASLALGVNEDCGLRCLYHGWKFTADGECVDTPTESDTSGLKARVRARAYPTREAGGVVWTYMGPAAEEPPFPHFEWFDMPAGHSAVFKIREDCNYAQAVEGTIDSAHAGVLHRHVPWSVESDWTHEKDLKPKLEVEYTKYGLRYGAVRKAANETAHVRVTQVVLPFYTFIPPDGFGPRKNRRLVNAFVPRDDVSTWHIQWFFDESQPIDVAHRIDEGGHWLDGEWRKKLNIENWYEQDREAMRTGQMSGIRGIVTQDHAVSETQGEILDRSQEHLGTSDVAVVAWRRLMLKTARALAEKGDRPAMLLGQLPWSEVKGVTAVYPADGSWKDAAPLPAEVAQTSASAA